MRLSKISIYDVKNFLSKHSLWFISFLIIFLVGVLFGIINSLSSDNYLKILTSENKLIYSFINDNANNAVIFWKYIWKLLLPLILIFVLGLNFYLCFGCYLIIAYQSAMLTMSIFAIVSTYGASGVLNVLFIILPLNLIYLVVLILFASENLSRSYMANKLKTFGYNYRSFEYLCVSVVSVLSVICICFVGTIIIPLFLKNAIFLIF